MERATLSIDSHNGSPESWELARAFAQSVGTFPSSFTSVVRLLVNDYDRGSSEPSQFGRFFMSRLLKAPSLQAAYFFAIKNYKPELIGTRNVPFAFDNFIDAFSGLEHGAILALISICRHTRKFSEQRAFDHIVPRLCRSLNLGYFIGEAIPSIGPGTGMIGSACRVLGLIPFLRHDPEKFEEYWQHLHTTKQEYDAALEQEFWKCTSLQVAGMICQQVGLGLSRSVPLMRALTVDSVLLSADDDEAKFRATNIWLKTLVLRRKTPDIPLPPKFYPNKAALDKLLKKSIETMTSTETHWLMRTKDSVSAEFTPQLYIGDSPCLTNESFAIDPTPRNRRDETPEVLRETLSEETISALSDKLLSDVLEMSEDSEVEPPEDE